LDQLHQDTFAATLSPDWTGTAQETVDLTLLGRYYARFGDHGDSVARRITFLVTGDFHAEHSRVADARAAHAALRVSMDDDGGAPRDGGRRRRARHAGRAGVPEGYLPWLATAAMASFAASGSR